MGRRAINVLRLMELPYKFGSGNPITGGRRYTVLVNSETVVLTPDDSGATVILGGDGIGIATLPAVASGLWFNFVSVSAHVHIVNGGASVIQGCVHHNTNGTTIGRSVATNETTAALDSTNPKAGDTFRMVCDGTNWYIDGLTNAAMAFA